MLIGPVSMQDVLFTDFIKEKFNPDQESVLEARAFKVLTDSHQCGKYP